MAWSANGNEFTSKSLSRVKYSLLVEDTTDDLKFKGSAPEIIKIALNTSTEAAFFGISPDYTPIYFDPDSLNQIYGDQIFLDVANQKNFIWLSESVSGDCLTEMQNFINYIP